MSQRERERERCVCNRDFLEWTNNKAESEGLLQQLLLFGGGFDDVISSDINF